MFLKVKFTVIYILIIIIIKTINYIYLNVSVYKINEHFSSLIQHTQI